MIISFSIANFRSFREEQTFSMVASNRFSGSHEHHVVPIPDSEAKVLRIGLLYGANASGKSNFFKALSYLKKLALQTRDKGQSTGRSAFRFAQASSSDPSVFDLQFISNGKAYRYGIVVDDETVIEEWLLRVKGKREEIIFERSHGKNGSLQIKFARDFQKDKKLSALGTIGGPHNQSFLATIQATLDAADIPLVFEDVLSWFGDDFRMIHPESRFLPLAHFLKERPSFLEFTSQFLKGASTGIDELQVQRKEVSLEQVRNLLPEKRFTRLMEGAHSDKNHRVIPLSPHQILVVDHSTPDQFYTLTVQSKHSHETGEPVFMDMIDESDGTRRLLDLIPALQILDDEGGCFVVDEIDRSMHPLLIWKFLEFFLESCTSQYHQMIITTHESNLLDKDLLRRDAVWFVEKNQKGESHLFPLSDFKIRNDLKIDKHYLQGRFGAIPFLGDIDRLKENPPELINA